MMDEKAQDLHPSQERFRELLDELAEFQAGKQQKYSNGEDPFANYRKSEAWGVPAWVACMVRVEDKVSRLQNLANGVDLGEEGAYDAFRDIAVGALNALILWEELEYDSDEELPEPVVQALFTPEYMNQFGVRLRQLLRYAGQHGTNHDDAIAAQTDDGDDDPHQAHDEYKRLGRDPEQDDIPDLDEAETELAREVVKLKRVGQDKREES